MAISPRPSSVAVAEAVEELMRLYRSLPPRPSVEEVEAASAVVRSADAEEELRIAEIARAEKPPDVPDELFFVLQEARRNLALLRSHEQRGDAARVLDLDRRFQVFDDLIQRASRLVSGEEGGEEEEEQERRGLAGVKAGGRAERGLLRLEKDEKMKERKAAELDGSVGFRVSQESRASSLKSGTPAGSNTEKLSLIQVASLIEALAKKETRVLDLQGKLMDQIEWLPVSLGKLQDITELNLSENRIMALPPSILSLRSLAKLDIHSNQLINLPDSFGELSNLIDLDLHANRLTHLPASFGKLTRLSNLDLSSNQLSALPDSLGNLTNLRRLNVETNELEELPYTIGYCTALVELRLDFNKLKALPEAVGKLENLEILTLHYNRIKGLPTTIGSLSKLRELDVSFNELELIPENLCLATSLVKLNVGRNFADLRALPKSIGNLEMLEELDISSNQIRTLPESFRFLLKLREFDADETPLEVPPREVVLLGAQAVVQYMADLVAARDANQQNVVTKGFWFWLCSLFRPQRKNREMHSGLSSV